MTTKKKILSLGFGFCRDVKQEVSSKMGTEGEKIVKEISEITLQSIYDLLSRRGYKTQKACD